MIEYQGSYAGFGRCPAEHGKSTPVAEFSLPRVFFFAAQKEGWNGHRAGSPQQKRKFREKRSQK